MIFIPYSLYVKATSGLKKKIQKLFVFFKFVRAKILS